MTSTGRDTRRTWAQRDWWPWAAGLALGGVVLGPGLAFGSLLNLDLVLTPRIDVADGIWGLGAEVPRRAPFYVVLAWLSAWGGGAGAWKILAVAATATAFAGAARLVRDESVVVRAGAGLVYAASPWVLTRLGVGHLGLVVAAALLPWALDTLLDPARSLPRTFLWSLAFALAGVFGALLAGPLLVAGLVGLSGRAVWRSAAAFAAPHAIWLLPGAIVLAQGAHPSSAAAFRPPGDGVTDALRLLAGHGFWQPRFQVGWQQGWLAIGAGAVLVGFGVFGHRELTLARRDRLAAVAAGALLVPVAARLPGLDRAFDVLSDTVIGLPIREPQRLLVVYLLWLAPAAAVGARRLADRLGGAVGGVLVAAPAVLALLLAAPGMWGVQGALEPVRYPAGWVDVRAAVTARPGPVVALPWYRYFDLDIAEGRRVLNPMPYYLGGDVLVSSDPELPGGRRESVDPREPAVERLIDRMRAGDSRTSTDLADLGIRWVVLMRDVDWGSYPVEADPGLEWTAGDGTVALYEVISWAGPVADGTAGGGQVHCVVPFVCRSDSDGGRWARPGAPGWYVGRETLETAPGGTLVVPPGEHWLVFVPGVAVALVDGAVVIAAAWCVYRLACDRRAPGENRASPARRWVGRAT